MIKASLIFWICCPKIVAWMSLWTHRYQSIKRAGSHLYVTFKKAHNDYLQVKNKLVLKILSGPKSTVLQKASFTFDLPPPPSLISLIHNIYILHINIFCEWSSTVLKQDLVNFDMLTTFSFWVSSNLSQQKSPTAEIIGMYFLGTIVLREKIYANNFCCWALWLQ